VEERATRLHFFRLGAGTPGRDRRIRTVWPLLRSHFDTRATAEGGGPEARPRKSAGCGKENFDDMGPARARPDHPRRSWAGGREPLGSCLHPLRSVGSRDIGRDDGLDVLTVEYFFDRQFARSSIVYNEGSVRDGL